MAHRNLRALKHMNALTVLEIILRPLVALILFGTAAVGGYYIERAGRRRGWNGRLWRYLTHRHHVAPRTEADRRNWHGVFWALFATLAIFTVIWFSDPLPHNSKPPDNCAALHLDADLAKLCRRALNH